MKKATTYADAGVNIDAGDALVKKIAPLAKATERAGSMGSLGGFGGLFDLKATGYKDPILVSGTDGVGTKLKIAHTIDKHDTIGIDLVAMCVNDVLVQGAEPLFFLDYFACGKLAVGTAASVISGIAEGCKQANCALIGGETAEMPGMYAEGEYDLAGFAVGAVERDKILPRSNIMPGDALIGLPSSGIHSNGYSLVRHIVEHNKLDYAKPAEFDPKQSLGEALLTPTQIYVSSLGKMVKTGLIKGLAHITGGGITENLPRVLPHGVDAEIDLKAFPQPPVFKWLMKSGNVSAVEMLRTFNCGLGMIAVVRNSDVDTIGAQLELMGQPYHIVGRLIEGSGEAKVVYKHIEAFGG